MKKFVSMAMVAAMTTSMVPATAFAGVGEVNATAKIIDAWTMTEDFDGNVIDGKKSVPELQIKITDTNYKNTTVANEDYYAEITVALDNAELDSSFTTDNIEVILGSEAKDEMAADKNVNDTVAGAAQDEVDDLEKEIYGDTVENHVKNKVFAKEEPTETELKNNLTKGLIFEMYKAEADLVKVQNTAGGGQAALNTKVQADGRWVIANQAVTDAGKVVAEAQKNVNAEKAKIAAAQKAVKDAEAARDDAKNSVTNVIYAYDSNGEFDTTKTNKLSALELDATNKLAAYNKYVKALEDLNTAIETAKKANPQEADFDKDVDGSIANDSSEHFTLAQLQALVPNFEAAVSNTAANFAAAQEAVDVANAYIEMLEGKVTEAAGKVDDSALEALETELQDAKDAETAAKENLDEVEATIKEELLKDDAKVKEAQQKYDDAVNALNTKVDELIAAYEKLEEAEGNKGNSDAALTSKGFEVVAVEGISGGKAKAAVKGADEFTFGIKGKLHKGDVISIDLATVMDKTSVGKQATLDVESDDLNLDVADLVYVGVEDYGITATVKKLANVAEEEKAHLEKDLKIESTVGDFAKDQEIELKLSNGFEFDKLDGVAGVYSATIDDDKAVLTVLAATDEIVIPAEAMKIEAVKAKSGDVATITVKAKDTKNVAGAFAATAKVEVMKVVDYTVMLSVDADEDVPVIYSGVNVANDFITDDSDHLSLEVTVEESFPGAWSMRKGFNLELPDGVYVTNVELVEQDALYIDDSKATSTDVIKAFEKAYKDGDHKNFEFEKRVFNDVDSTLDDDCASMTFQLELVADPTFAGDVNLKFKGDLVDEQEVTIAKFQPIAVVKAEQNDLKIDYRYTEIPTAITVTETAAGLWEEGSEFWMAFDKADVIEFEDGATFEATGGMEVDDFEKDCYSKSAEDWVNSIGFTVDEESDEAATVTISNLSLFMQRNIPAGAYDLTAGSNAFGSYLFGQRLFAPDCGNSECLDDCFDKNNDCYITDVEDFSDVVKEAFVNVVTAGREQDDASFTTKVVVPVGESYIVAGEAQVNLDVPAYVSAAGYTMLPVRAVATALGINNNNVIWNGETKTVTILYGQRIITMVAGQKTVNVNGSVIPASAAVEIVDGRTFLPMRDLATALGVTDITWDAATKTATLNGNV